MSDLQRDKAGGITENMDGSKYLDMLRQQDPTQIRSFQEFSKYLEGKAREQGIPIRGQFELTPLCNLNCKMCYVHLSTNQIENQSLLSVEQWKDIMHNAYETGMLYATLTGGECLTYPGFDDLYLYLQSKGCMVDVLTNGVLLNEERIRFFQAHPPCTIQVTLYGSNDDAYERVTGRRAYHDVVKNLRMAKEAELPLIISVTPSRTMGEDVFDTMRSAWSLTHNLFVNSSLFTPPGSNERVGAEEELDVASYARIFRLQKELHGTEVKECDESLLPEAGGSCADCEAHGLSCGGGRSGFVINWKGEMLICNRMEPKSSVLQHGFAEAWKQIHTCAENWQCAAECRGCAYEEFCGICAAEALKYAPPGEKPEALCRKTKYLISRGVLHIPVCE